MTAVKVCVESAIQRSFRVDQVVGMLDVPLNKRLIHERLRHERTAEVPGWDEPWSIGAIVGPSGSGKTTLARQAFGHIHEPEPWPKNCAVIEGLDATGSASSIKELARVLIGVGLGSVPTWLKPYHVLSGGERFRVDLARALIAAREPAVVIDEFTSLLDRPVALTSAAAVARLVRRGLMRSADRSARVRLVALTCHTDVLPWLAPDWVIRLKPGNDSQLIRNSFPALEVPLIVERTKQQAWQTFAKHHYLTGGLAASATCYQALWPGFDDEGSARPVAFCAVAPTLGWKGTKHIARLVTLPDFQGLGIGGRLLDRVAELELEKGSRVTITASHPAVTAHCGASSRWRLASIKKTGSTRQNYRGRTIRCSTGRAVASFKFVQS